MANTKPEILPFAVDNTADCEQYLFLNHPTTFISLTTESKKECHSSPCPNKSTSPRYILKSPPLQHTATFAADPAAPVPAPAPPMARKSSTTSTSTNSTFEEDDYLGGGGLRHISSSDHLRELAELAELDQQAKARRWSSSSQQTQMANLRNVVRKPHEKQGGWLESVMQWWPEQMEAMEHEWTEEFYE